MATPSMSMNKVIHCAVRRDLRRFRAALDTFQDGDKARAAALHRAWDNFDAQLTEHHEGEHEVAWPALKAIGVDQTSIDAFDEEHEAMAAALRTARAAMDKLARSGHRPTPRRPGRDGGARGDHHHPPRPRGGEIEPLYQKEQDDPAVKQMGKQFSRRTSLGKAGVFFAWMDDGATAEETRRTARERPGAGARDHRRALRPALPQGGRPRLGVDRLVLTP